MRIRWKLPLAFALTTLVFAGIVALVTAVSLREVFLDRLQDDMSRQVQQYAAVLEASSGGLDDPAALQSLTEEVGEAGEVRFTLIDSAGEVLADSEVDPTTLDNHADRPEVRQALAGNEGRERRESATLGQEEVYVAAPLPAGDAEWSEGVLRAALPAGRIDSMLAASWRIPLIVWAALLIPMLGVAYLLTRSLTRPLEKLRFMTSRVASGDFSFRTSVHRSDELGELADSLNSMAGQLEARAQELTEETQRTSGVLTAMTEGVLLVDGSGRLVRANPAAGRILGARFEGTEGVPLVHTARSFPAGLLAEKARAAEGPITEVLQPGGSRSLTVEVVPLPTTGAGPGQTLFVIRDETVRMATERMRRDFATNVSHELKTPLAGLSLTAQILARAIHDDPEQAEKSIARLSAEVDRLTDLTNDLLTLSRLEEAESQSTRIGRDETPVLPAFVPVDLSAVALAAADEVRPQAAERRHELSVETQSGLMVSGDDPALRTLVRNLLDNAVRYTEPGGHIRLATRTEEDAWGRAWAVLSVEDDGAGIPMADQERVFERFYRVDKDRSRQSGGTGLGLSIVRHVAEYHGGRVELQSTQGVGSTFTVRIPTLG